jgi:hypothetical protein
MIDNTLTVEQLIKRLKKLPPKVKVMTYIDEAEEYGIVENVELISKQDDIPYSKGQELTLDTDESLVLIRGWIG